MKKPKLRPSAPVQKGSFNGERRRRYWLAVSVGEQNEINRNTEVAIRLVPKKARTAAMFSFSTIAGIGVFVKPAKVV